MKLRHNISRNSLICILTILILIISTQTVFSQTQPELEKALMKMGRVWAGVTANGAKSSFDYRAGFFPNDYDIIGVRGQQQDAWVGAGFKLTATNWVDPIDTLHLAAVFGPTNDFMPQGKVVVPMTNFIRYKFPTQIIDFKPVELDDFGTYDPDQFGDETYDQIVEVTAENILGVQVNRRIMSWSQSLNNDYIIVDVEFENVSADTLYDFYINVESNGQNTYRSLGNNPVPASAERPDFAATWQHYYGGRVGDTMRVFYEYSADNPDVPGDNMGSPVVTQGGRLINQNFIWYAILHASQAPYVDAVNDVDDFLQPKGHLFRKKQSYPV